MADAHACPLGASSYTSSAVRTNTFSLEAFCDNSCILKENMPLRAPVCTEQMHGKNRCGFTREKCVLMAVVHVRRLAGCPQKRNQ